MTPKPVHLITVSSYFFNFVAQQEELEKQKQEQVALLQELEEQKVKLEQMLLEAQQEREHLKAAVQARDEQARSSQPEVPVVEVTSVTEVGFCLVVYCHTETYTFCFLLFRLPG